MTQGLGVQGEFRLLQKIGEGGMADVFLAERLGDDGFRTRVALKRLHRGLAMDSYFIRQLIREARLLGQLEHANIVKVYDLRRIGDEYYVVMEYVDGIDLAGVIGVHRKRNTRVPRPFFFHVALSLAESLAYAHSAVDEAGEPTPLIHRDIKPSNVMLSRRGIVKLTDFGIAHVGDGSITGGLVQGTANYMSPEQAYGEERLTSASDVYSLGAVFYEMLTGQPLNDGDNYLKAIHQVRERVVSLDELAEVGLEPGLRMVIAKMLARDVKDRYQDTESVRNDLQFVADRLKIDLSGHRIRTYVQRLMGILGRAPDRATLSNMKADPALMPGASPPMPTPSVGSAVALPATGDLGSTDPASSPPSSPDASKGPVTMAVEKDFLDSKWAEEQLKAAGEAGDDLGPEGTVVSAADLAAPVDSEASVRPPSTGDAPTGSSTVALDPDTLSGREAGPGGPLHRAESPGPAPSGDWDDAATRVYDGQSPAESGVMGAAGPSHTAATLQAPPPAGQMEGNRPTSLAGGQLMTTAAEVDGVPAEVEMMATGALMPGRLEEDTDVETWAFTESAADTAVPVGKRRRRRQGGKRRRRKNSRRRRPIPPLITALLVFTILVLFCAILLAVALRPKKKSERNPQTSTVVIVVENTASENRGAPLRPEPAILTRWAETS